MTVTPNPRLFCFGFGYSARALAERLLAKGWRVAGTTRDPAKVAELETAGIESRLFDRDRPLDDPGGALAGVTHLLSSVPPDARGDSVLDLHGADIAACGDLVWMGYLSTTGIYGDRQGDWVDEDSEPRPTGERGRRRLAAEVAWGGLWRDHGVPLHLFRLSGIYGPGRNALAKVRAGTAVRIAKPELAFSRIHVADLAAVLEASMARPNPGRIYNVSDDRPAPPAEVIAHACELLGRAAPPPVPLETAELSPLARDFYRDNKRVRNRRIKEELSVTLAYPDYKAGLRALHAAGE